ncbi:g963 [Coccomyxa elongata]
MDERERSLSKYYFSESNYAAVHDVLSHFASQRYRMDIDATGAADRILDIMKAVYDTRAPFSGDHERYILALNQRVISEVFRHVEHLSAATQRRTPALSERPTHAAEDRSDIVKSYNDAVDNRKRALEGAILGAGGKRSELRSDVVIPRPDATSIEPESVDGPNNTMEMLARMEADRKRMDEGPSDPPAPHSMGLGLPQSLDPIPEVDEEEQDTPGGTMEQHLLETKPKRRIEVHAQVSDPPRLAVPANPERQSRAVPLSVSMLDSVAVLQSNMQDRFESWTESLLRDVADVKKDLTSAKEAAPRVRTEVLSSLARSCGDLSSWLTSMPCAARVTHLLIPTTPAVHPFGRACFGGVETLFTPSRSDDAFTRLELADPVDVQAGDITIKLLDCLGLPLPIPVDRCAIDSVSQQSDSLLIGVKSDHGLRTGDQVRLQGMSGSVGLIAQLHRPEGHPAMQVDRRHFQVRLTDECGPVTGLGEAVNMKRQVYVFFDRQV